MIFCGFIILIMSLNKPVLKECDLTKETLSLDFVGYPLELETKFVKECNPNIIKDSSETHPASIVFRMKTSDFSAFPSIGPHSYKMSEDEIRIFLSSYTEASDETHLVLNLVFKQFDGRRVGQIRVYNQEESKIIGLEYYKKTQEAPQRLAKEVYLQKNANGDINFILRCGFSYSICGCKADERVFKNSLSYSYCFNSTYVLNALEIDKKVQDFLGKILKGKEEHGRSH